MSPLFQTNLVDIRKIVAISNWPIKYCRLGPYINNLVGNDAINIIGTKEKRTFLNNPVYIESGLVENFMISWLSQPATEKFLNQKHELEIINSTLYHNICPKINESKKNKIFSNPIGCG